MLVDAGCEYLFYAADITSKNGDSLSKFAGTFPANGRFTEKQRVVYDIVLNAQKALIQSVTPGLDFRWLGKQCSLLLANGLIKVGTYEQTVTFRQDLFILVHQKKLYRRDLCQFSCPTVWATSLA